MSSYASTTDLVTMSIASTAIASVATASQQAVLDAASIEADGYLAAQYHLPITAWGADLKQHVCDIAAYRLMCLRGYSPGGSDDIFRERYDDAIAWLKLVAQGTVSPPNIVDSTPAVREGAPEIQTGLGGNTVGGGVSPQQYLGGPTAYPFVGAVSGRRGW